MIYNSNFSTFQTFIFFPFKFGLRFEIYIKLYFPQILLSFPFLRLKNFRNYLKSTANLFSSPMFFYQFASK